MANIKEIFQDVLVFWFVGQILYLPILMVTVFFALLFTRFWFLTVLYGIFIFYDRHTPQKGGRFNRFLVKLPFWGLIRSYFPHELVRTADLPSDRNYMLGVHPHGIYNLTFFLEALYLRSDYAEKFPGIRVQSLALDQALILPFHREFLMGIGMTSISRRGFEYWLRKQSQGVALKFSIGGLEEVLDSKPNTMVINLKKKKGFCKLALKYGVSLVPVIQFGENELFQANESFSGLQKFLIKNFGFYLPICSGRWINMPNKRPIYTVVGKPIHVEKVPEPTNDQVDELHAQYVESVKALYDEYSPIYGSKQIPLIIN